MVTTAQRLSAKAKAYGKREREQRRQQRTEVNDASLFFSKLPPELRNRIYTFAIDANDIIDVYGDSYTGSEEDGWTHVEARNVAAARRVRRTQSAIIQTCQQMRNEAFGLFYARSIFLFNLEREVTGDYDDYCFTWIASVHVKGLGALTRIMVRGGENDDGSFQCARFNVKSGELEFFGEEDRVNKDCLACAWISEDVASQLKGGEAVEKDGSTARLVKLRGFLSAYEDCVIGSRAGSDEE